MKKTEEKDRGITLIALVVTIIVLLILASIITYSGVSTIRGARYYNAISEMKVMQAKVNEIYEEYKYSYNKQEFINKYGENIQGSSIEIQAQTAFNSVGIDSEIRSQYKYYNADYIKNNLDLDGIDYDFLVNIKTRDVILLQGIEKDGQTYYSLSQIPNEQYNIQYDKSDMLTASIELKDSGEKKVRVVLHIPNNDEYYSYKTIINGEEFQSGTTNRSLVIMNEYETEFDEEITAYVEIQYEEQTIKTNEVTKNDYTIKTADELKKLSKNVNNGKSYENITITQIADIDLKGNSNNQWAPIGTEANQFVGIYEGNNHKISNIYINATESYQGLFGCNKGTIENINIDGNITSTSNIIGGIAGKNLGEIQNCISDVVVMGLSIIGGIVGQNEHKIMNCTNLNQIEGIAINLEGGHVGGIVGRNSGLIEKSQNYGNIISKSNCTGGIVGVNFQTISLCFNTGKINSSGYSGTGGIIGYQVGNSLNNCYNKGSVTGVQNVGGLVGHNGEGTISNSYNLGTITSTDILSGSIIGSIIGSNQGILKNSYSVDTIPINICGENLGTIDDISSPKSGTEMKNGSFITTLNVDGEMFKYDSNNINDGYPILIWQ